MKTFVTESPRIKIGGFFLKKRSVFRAKSWCKLKYLARIYPFVQWLKNLLKVFENVLIFMFYIRYNFVACIISIFENSCRELTAFIIAISVNFLGREKNTFSNLWFKTCEHVFPATVGYFYRMCTQEGKKGVSSSGNMYFFVKIKICL